MIEIVINQRQGVFGLSREARKRICVLKGLTSIDIHDLQRDDPDLISVVKQLGSLASGDFCDLKIVAIPQDVNWMIEEDEGHEWVAEKHRTWT